MIPMRKYLSKHPYLLNEPTGTSRSPFERKNEIFVWKLSNVFRRGGGGKLQFQLRAPARTHAFVLLQPPTELLHLVENP